jgi:hypothetical protein
MFGDIPKSGNETDEILLLIAAMLAVRGYDGKEAIQDSFLFVAGDFTIIFLNKTFGGVPSPHKVANSFRMSAA